MKDRPRGQLKKDQPKLILIHFPIVIPINWVFVDGTATAAILDIHIWDSSIQQLAGHSPRTIYKNPVNGLAPFRVLVAQLVEHPPGVRKVMGSNAIGNSDFFPSLFMCVSTIPLKYKRKPTYSNRCNILASVFESRAF